MLKDFYESNGGGVSKGVFEVVFVSADHEAGGFVSYFQNDHGPWAAVDFDESCRERLQSEYKISGIPSLKVVESATGRMLEDNVRSLDGSKLAGWLSMVGKPQEQASGGAAPCAPGGGCCGGC